MDFAKRVFLFFLVFYTMAAQPGLPACWLMQKSCAVHFHLAGMAEVPHLHGYLFEQVSANAVIELPLAVFTAGQMLLLLGLVNIWKMVFRHPVFYLGWTAEAQYPPPRKDSLLFAY